jgi:hypothetical protein
MNVLRYTSLGDILTREHDYAGAAAEKNSFLRIVPDAYDADEIKDQIKILEDFSTEKESAGVASIN